MPFGLRQTNKPTPQRIALLFDLLAAACGIISGFVTTAAFISHGVSDVVSSLLTALVIPLLLLFKRFFSVDVDISKTTVPIADVKVMEETEEIPKRD
jgi:hypothetical protein